MTRCLVPFCERRQAGSPLDDWICAGHWRLVDRRLRLRHKRWIRKRTGPSPFWQECREQAVMRAAMETA